MFRLYCIVIISAAFSIIGTSALHGQTNPTLELESAPSINTIASFGLSEGLPGNCLKNTVIDQKGRLWVSPCADTWLDDKYNFFQYDGRKAFNYEILPEGITAPMDTTLHWFVWGETANGFLYGTDYNLSTVFYWHPDLRKQNFFRLDQGASLLNLASEPGGSILVLTLESDTYKVYRLTDNNKQKIGEITLDFTYEFFYNDTYIFPIQSFTIVGQKAWFFHERSGLVAVDLADGKMQFHSWSKLGAKQMISESAYYQGGGLTWQMLPYSSDQLLLY
ncbi:MAG: hypothetical protein AAF705_11250, partial [Bacteroidota bacterium]